MVFFSYLCFSFRARVGLAVFDSGVVWLFVDGSDNDTDGWFLIGL